MSSRLKQTHTGEAAEKVTKGTPLTRGACRALWIGTAGTINVTTAAGQALTNFPAKEGLMPMAVQSVEASGTADDIWALY